MRHIWPPWDILQHELRTRRCPSLDAVKQTCVECVLFCRVIYLSIEQSVKLLGSINDWINCNVYNGTVKAMRFFYNCLKTHFERGKRFNKG